MGAENGQGSRLNKNNGKGNKMSSLVPRQTIEHIVQCRDNALDLYEKAFSALEEADKAIKLAHEMAHNAAPLGVGNFTYDRIAEIDAFYKAIVLPDRELFLKTARKITDILCWQHIVKMTDLERLMDVEAKNQLRDQMRYIPEKVNHNGQVITQDEAAKGMPPITIENIYATLEAFRGDVETIFRRGIANAFSKLDRRFKSHDGFKIGNRIILTRFFNEWGSMSYGNQRETLIDVERVFSVLDGISEASFQSTLWVIEEGRRGQYSARQSEHESAYFKVRCFQNGNAHLWFTRKDLVEKVNKILAEYYGEVIADGRQGEEDVFANKKTTPARNFGFFPTPDAAANILIDYLPLRNGQDEKPLRILEPSAGTGNLARRLQPVLNKVDCVEVQHHFATTLDKEGLYNRVTCADFLTLRPEPVYDLVVMNPPFDLERDIDHVTHAFQFLKSGGQLWAIMSAGTEFRETKKATAFRKLLEDNLTSRYGSRSFHDLPAGSFKDVGTNVNTVIVGMRKK